jgi:hypothetical protein
MVSYGTGFRIAHPQIDATGKIPSSCLGSAVSTKPGEDHCAAKRLFADFGSGMYFELGASYVHGNISILLHTLIEWAGFVAHSSPILLIELCAEVERSQGE